MSTRENNDGRGRGIGDAARLFVGATELIQAFSEPDWVAEEPEIHLRSHVEAWCQHDERLALTDDPDAYVLELEWRGANSSVGKGGQLSSRLSASSPKLRPMSASAV